MKKIKQRKKEEIPGFLDRLASRSLTEEVWEATKYFLGKELCHRGHSNSKVL